MKKKVTIVALVILALAIVIHKNTAVATWWDDLKARARQAQESATQAAQQASKYVQQTAQETSAYVQQKAEQASVYAQEKAQQARQAVEQTTQKVTEQVQSAQQQVRSTAEQLAQQAREIARRAKEAADTALNATGLRPADLILHLAALQQEIHDVFENAQAVRTAFNAPDGFIAQGDAIVAVVQKFKAEVHPLVDTFGSEKIVFWLFNPLAQLATTTNVIQLAKTKDEFKQALTKFQFITMLERIRPLLIAIANTLTHTIALKQDLGSLGTIVMTDARQETLKNIAQDLNALAADFDVVIQGGFRNIDVLEHDIIVGCITHLDALGHVIDTLSQASSHIAQDVRSMQDQQQLQTLKGHALALMPLAQSIPTKINERVQSAITAGNIVGVVPAAQQAIVDTVQEMKTHVHALIDISSSLAHTLSSILTQGLLIANSLRTQLEVAIAPDTTMQGFTSAQQHTEQLSAHLAQLRQATQ
jgi:hypothetical protein